MSLRQLQRYVRSARREIAALTLPPSLEDLVRPLVEGLSQCQRAVFRHVARFRVLVAGRRFGKTHLACVELLVSAGERPGSRNWYVGPTYRQSKEIAWRQLKRMVPREFILGSPNETDLSIRLLNGSQIALRGADNPDSLRGVGLDFVVLDEFAWIDESAWEEVLRPSLADRNGRALFITTPRGFNWAYDHYQRGRGDREDWQAWQFTTAEGGWVSETELQAAREQLDPRIFQQEFLATFENLTGRVYSNFSREHYPAGNVDPDLEDTGTDLLVGLDFNVDPMSAVLAVREGRECHVLDAWEIPVSNTQEVADELLTRYPDHRIIVCPDPSGRARKTSAPVGVTDFTILRRAGFEIRAPSAAPPVADRVNNTEAMLVSAKGERRTRIHPRAQVLIRALDGLTYKPGTSQPDKSLGLDHITDALGYLLWEEFNVLESRRARMFTWRI